MSGELRTKIDELCLRWETLSRRVNSALRRAVSSWTEESSESAGDSTELETPGK